MLLTKSNLPGIQAAGYADNILQIKLVNGEVIEFYGTSEETYNSFLTSTDAMNFICNLKHQYRWKSLGVLLG